MKNSIITSFFFLLVSSIHSQTLRINFTAPGTYPEGITYYAGTDVFYVSSARTGTIGKVTTGGRYTVVYKDSTLKSTFGMKIDAAKKILWVCTGDPNYSIYQDSSTHKRMIRLVGIDLGSGKKIKDIDLSGIYKGYHFGNDIALDNAGNIYMTDSFSPVIYKIDAGGTATVFAESPLFSSAGVGLNGLAWHPSGYLLVANNGSGSILKVDGADPAKISKVMINQFFPGADGLLLEDAQHLLLVQNKGVNKVFRINSTDEWMNAKVTDATASDAMFSYPSTATAKNKDIWIMNAKLNELSDSNTVISSGFSIQLAKFLPAK